MRCALLGRGAEEVLGLPVTPWLTRTAASGDRAAESDTEVTLYDASGHVAATGLQVRPLANRDGSLAWAVYQASATGTLLPDTSGEMLRALFTGAPVGLYILDTELRILSANVAAHKMCDAPPDSMLGNHLTDVHSFTSADEVETMLCAVLDSGEPSPERAVRMAPGDTTSRPRVKGLSAFRLEDSQGAVLGVVAALVDVGERAAEKAKVGKTCAFWPWCEVKSRHSVRSTGECHCVVPPSGTKGMRSTLRHIPWVTSAPPAPRCCSPCP